MFTYTVAPRRWSVNQTRVVLSAIAFLLVGVGIFITLHHHKILVADYPDPKNGADCTDDFCDVVASGYGTGQNDGNTLGLIPYGQTYNGSSGQTLGKIRVADTGAQTYANRCTPSDPANGYDGNYFGIRGQNNDGSDNPVWWYQPPTNATVSPGRTVAAQCKNNWNAGNGHSYANVTSGGNVSINEDPANFLNPGKAYTFNIPDLPSGSNNLPAGWADNSAANNGYVSNHPGQTWRNPVVLGGPGGDAGKFSTLNITCGGCNNSVSMDGATFIYRVRFQLDPSILASYNLDSAVLRTYANTWSRAWVDSTGKATDDDGNTPSPCRYDGVCLSSDDTTGYGLEAGVANGDDLTQYFRDNPGGWHVLAIQVTAKNYSGSGYPIEPLVAFHLVFSWSQKPPAPSINVTKSVSVANPAPGMPNAAQPGSTLSYTVKVQASGAAGSFPYSYNLSDVFTPPTAGCLTYQGNGQVSGAGGAAHAFDPGQTLKRTFNGAGTDTLTMSYIANSSGTVCPDGSTIQNTGTATYDSGSSSSTVKTPFYIAYSPFIVTKYGDVHSNGNDGNPSIDTNPGSVATYIVSAKNSISNFNSGACLIFYTNNGCNGQGGGYGTLAWPWDENPAFYHNLNNPGVLGVTAQAIGANTSGDIGPGFYVYNGSNLTLTSLKIHGATTIYASNPSAQVKINGGITPVPGSGQSSIPALFIVAGSTQSSGQSCTGSNISIDNGVTNIQDTTLFTAGTIQTADQQTANVLTMTGALIGCKIDLTNRIGQDSSNPPAAEEYDYIGNFILNPPPGMLNLGQTTGTLFYTGQGLPQL